MFSRDREKHPGQRPPAALHGVVFDILAGSANRVGLAARKRGLPSRSSRPRPPSPEGLLLQSVFAFAALKLRRTPRFAGGGPACGAVSWTLSPLPMTALSR